MRRWTEEDEEILRKYYPTDISVEEIAEMLGKTPAAVRTKAFKMGLKRNNLPKYLKKYLKISRRYRL